MPDPSTLEHSIRSTGFTLLGQCPLTADDRLPERFTHMLVVGSAGSAFADAFLQSPEHADGHDHPLDRWTRRVLEPLALSAGCGVVFPFDGPPWFPFQQWAMRADPRFHPSPLGLLVHPDLGLWAGLRAAFLLEEPIDIPAASPSPSPCAACVAKPCLAACPVHAFGVSGYDAAGCRTHLATPAGKTCLDGGCLARHACPLGREFTTPPEMARWHMQAFARAGSQTGKDAEED